MSSDRKRKADTQGDKEVIEIGSDTDSDDNKVAAASINKDNGKGKEENESAEDPEDVITARIEAKVGTGNLWRVSTRIWYNKGKEEEHEKGPYFTSEWQALLYCAKANSGACSEEAMEECEGERFDPALMSEYSLQQLREYNNWFESALESDWEGEITTCYETKNPAAMPVQDLVRFVLD